MPLDPVSRSLELATVTVRSFSTWSLIDLSDNGIIRLDGRSITTTEQDKAYQMLEGLKRKLMAKRIIPDNLRPRYAGYDSIDVFEQVDANQHFLGIDPGSQLTNEASKPFNSPQNNSTSPISSTLMIELVESTPMVTETELAIYSHLALNTSFLRPHPGCSSKDYSSWFISTFVRPAMVELRYLADPGPPTPFQFTIDTKTGILIPLQQYLEPNKLARFDPTPSFALQYALLSGPTSSIMSGKVQFSDNEEGRICLLLELASNSRFNCNNQRPLIGQHPVNLGFYVSTHNVVELYLMTCFNCYPGTIPKAYYIRKDYDISDLNQAFALCRLFFNLKDHLLDAEKMWHGKDAWMIGRLRRAMESYPSRTSCQTKKAEGKTLALGKGSITFSSPHPMPQTQNQPYVRDRSSTHSRTPDHTGANSLKKPSSPQSQIAFFNAFDPSTASSLKWEVWPELPHISFASDQHLRLVRKDITSEAELKNLEFLTSHVHSLQHVIPWHILPKTPSTPPAMIMPHVTTLDTVLFLDTSETLLVCRNLVSAVNEFHKICFAHRDIKLDNIAVDQGDMAVYLLDFGEGLVCDQGRANLDTGFIGTEGKVAPEVQDGVSYSVMGADLWAVGSVLMELVTKSLNPRDLELQGIRDAARALMNKDAAARPDLAQIPELVL